MSTPSSDPLQIAQFRRCVEPPARCPLRAVGGATPAGVTGRLRCLGVEARGTAAGRLRDYIARDGNGTLRRTALTHGITVDRLTDEQIVERVADIVALRQVCLLVAVPDRPASGGRARQPAPRPMATGLTPSQYLPRPAPAPAPAPTPVNDSLETVDTVAQAAVLQDAARNGNAFCA